MCAVLSIAPAPAARCVRAMHAHPCSWNHRAMISPITYQGALETKVFLQLCCPAHCVQRSWEEKPETRLQSAQVALSITCVAAPLKAHVSSLEPSRIPILASQHTQVYRAAL